MVGLLTPRKMMSTTRYSVQHAFFYQADFYFEVPPLVSHAAAAYVSARYGEHANQFWNARRHGVPLLEKTLPKEARRSISRVEIIYEHVYTGTMFWKALGELHKLGTLNDVAVVKLLQDNYRTAWIHRDENARLRQRDRGKTLLDAWKHYESADIRLLSSQDTPFQYPHRL
jgi:hypothetical protein